MLIKQVRTISYICPACGLTHFESISLFDFSGKSDVIINCRCNKSQLKISTKDYKEYMLNIPCIGCGNHHMHSLKFYFMWVKPISIIKCNQNGIEYCLIGNDNEVRKQQDSLEKEKDVVASTVGFENSFKNSRVMLEVFNKIHDIAEQDNIVCECGCKEIAVCMLEDRIILQCKRCSGLEVMSAKDSFDLKKVLQKQQIILYKQIQYI